MQRYLIILLTTVLISCGEVEKENNYWDATYLANLIATDATWEKQYRDANIITENLYLKKYAGERTVKTLYPETDNELVIIYDRDKPQELYWLKSGSWTTPYGTVGDPIGILEKANGESLYFYGLGNEFPGKVAIDSGKPADKKLQFAVRPTSDVIPTEYYSYNKFASATQKAMDLKLYITQVQLQIPFDSEVDKEQ